MNLSTWLLGLGTLPLLLALVVSTGVVLVGVGLMPRPVRLADLLGRSSEAEAPLVEVGEGAGLLDRTGASLWRRLGAGPRISTALHLQGRTGADFMAEKFALALLGACLPATVGTIAWLMGNSLGVLPVGLVLVAALVGWFVPDLLLLRSRGGLRQAASEAVFTYIDLVTLERLANQSSTQALTKAAALSDAVLFTELRTALERARLEQRPAWQALDEVGARLELTPLRDVADVMRLDEQGAALSHALRARVRELRDGHLMTLKIEAERVSESLTLWMVVPALVFGLILLTPPLLRMIGG